MMWNTQRSFVGLALAAVLLCPMLALAQSGEQAHVTGKALLAKGDFRGALTAFATAVRADRTNQQYLDQYMLLRQAIEMRKRLESERDPKKWESLARALHTFYSRHGVYDEAIALDRRMHAKLKTASSALLLAETALMMDLNDEAARTLASVAPEKSTVSIRALLGVALARDGKADEAREIAERVVLPDKATPGAMYSVSRLRAATGNTAEALQLLVRCFESVTPSQLAGFKAHVKRSREFADLASDAHFVAALRTESKVPESKCSGGSSCAGCPMRGDCTASQGH